MDKQTIIYLDEISSQYHNHKEQMAYSIFALEGGFFIGLFFLGNWPASVERMPLWSMIVVIVITWFLFHTALRFQLRNRRLAAIQVAAYRESLLATEPVKYDPTDIDVPSSGLFLNLVDTFLFPIRKTIRLPDVRSEDLKLFMQRHAKTMHFPPHGADAVCFFIFKHQKKASYAFREYALPIEWITSLGSFLLLAFAMLRVLQSHGVIMATN